jgi:threonylcarbamoyladenosine tRNA methylthiotransferase CDKAL1
MERKYSQAAPNTPWLRDVSIVGVQQIDKIVTVVEETLRGNNVRMLSKRRTAGGIELLDLSMPKMSK